MATVQTVKGEIETSELGAVLMHEHVFAVNEEFRLNYQYDWDEAARIADAVDQLSELKQLGIDTIVDPTVLGIGRNIPRVQAVAAQVDLNIIVATGAYTSDEVPMQFKYVGPGLAFDVSEPLVEYFIRDITEGIADTGVRAAFLKCVIEEKGLTPGVERVMRAVGQASVETGAPVTVHTVPRTGSGLVAQRVLCEEGVDPTKIVLGHSGDSADLDYLMKLADGGSLLGMDRFGIDVFLPFDDRVNTIVELVGRGYASSIVISHDTCCFNDSVPQDLLSKVAPKWNFRHISEDVIPALLARGLSDTDINTILVDNPRRYFE